MNSPVRILGIAGSLRQASYNRYALQAAQDLLPGDTSLSIFELAGLPFYNQDTENEVHPRVQALKLAIRSADALLFVTPEYNYSIPGVPKNAIDCASRPFGDNSWAGKPVALMGASPGMFGSARAQYHLRQVFVALNLLPLNQPEVTIGHADKVFDGQGVLTDAATRDRIRSLLDSLARWTRQLRR